MTFTEAAIEVLRREGKPLHFKKIAEIAIRESLLDHVGKIPEDVMGGQLANHCRLPRPDRHVMVVQPGTFALVEWGLDEDPHGLDGIVEPPPENEPPYRPRERHPIPSKEMARSVGRGGEARARRREEAEERRARRFPPPAEVAFEILAGAERPLTVVEIAAQGAERALMPDAFVRDATALAAALAEDNRRREGAGRKALFAIEGDVVSLAAQPEPGERPAVSAGARAVSATDMRKAGLLALRRRIRECDGAAIEHISALLLEKLGFHELKVAKRGRDHVVYTARKKMGLGEVRHCVRVLRGAGEVSRREVGDVRRDIGNYGAQIGVVLSAGEAAREARADAAAPGQLPVILLCGDALAEAMAEAGLGCHLVAVPEVDEAFFKIAAETAAQDEAARRARREERERREAEAREERRARAEERRREKEKEKEAAAAAGSAAEVAQEVAPAAAAGSEPADEAAPDASAIERAAAERAANAAPPDENEDAEGDDGDEDEEVAGAAGAEEAAASAGAEGEPRKRRRRRRRRGGRGRGERRDGGAGAPIAAESQAVGAQAEPAAQEAGTAASEPANAGAEPASEASFASPAVESAGAGGAAAGEPPASDAAVGEAREVTEPVAPPAPPPRAAAPAEAPPPEPAEASKPQTGQAAAPSESAPAAADERSSEEAPTPPPSGDGEESR